MIPSGLDLYEHSRKIRSASDTNKAVEEALAQLREIWIKYPKYQFCAKMLSDRVKLHRVLDKDKKDKFF